MKKRTLPQKVRSPHSERMESLDVCYRESSPGSLAKLQYMPLPFYPRSCASHFSCYFMGVRAANQQFNQLIYSNSIIKMVLGQNKNVNVRAHFGVYHQLRKERRKKKAQLTHSWKIKALSAFLLLAVHPDTFFPLMGLSSLYLEVHMQNWLLQNVGHTLTFTTQSLFSSQTLLSKKYVLVGLLRLELTLWSHVTFSLPMAKTALVQG